MSHSNVIKIESAIKNFVDLSSNLKGKVYDLLKNFNTLNNCQISFEKGDQLNVDNSGLVTAFGETLDLINSMMLLSSNISSWDTLPSCIININNEIPVESVNSDLEAQYIVNFIKTMKTIESTFDSLHESSSDSSSAFETMSTINSSYIENVRRNLKLEAKRNQIE